MGRRKRCY